MRRWFCVLLLLAGFAGAGAPTGARVPNPVPIERPIGSIRGGRLERTAAWWQRR